jgi:hypothetical protein
MATSMAMSTSTGARVDAATPSPLVERRDDVEIDWSAGTVTATAGAAADLHRPSADVARAGAVRRAEAAARARLEGALAALPAGGGRKLDAALVTRALARARVTGTDYQSNGGVFVHLTARFADWLDPPPARDAPPVVTLFVPVTSLEASPLAKLEGQARERQLGAAVYRVVAAAPGGEVIPAKRDHAGRLVFDVGRDKALGDKLGRGVALVYVLKANKANR